MKPNKSIISALLFFASTTVAYADNSTPITKAKETISESCKEAKAKSELAYDLCVSDSYSKHAGIDFSTITTEQMELCRDKQNRGLEVFLECIAQIKEEKTQTINWPEWKPLPASNQPALENPLSSKELYRLAAPSVYDIKTYSDKQEPYTIGSGVAFSPTLLITVCHIFESDDEHFIREGEKQYALERLAGNPDSDLCILKTSDDVLVPVRGIRTLEQLGIAETVYSIGAAAGFSDSIGHGLVSGIRHSKRSGMSYIQTTAPTSLGSSGGGLFDSYGNLIGIPSHRRKNAQLIGFAIPIEAYLTERIDTPHN